MSYSIAVAGKGGSGKTSVACLIIRYLVNKGLTPVLAVDADGNANLGESLGLEVGDTIGSIIAEFNEEKISIPSGLTKGAYLELKLNEIVVESKGVDLISMGRGEGTGCYCYPNSVLKKFIDELKSNYKYMVMDNEAGMEHLSRRTTENVDQLFIISNHSVKGVRTVGRILGLIKDLKLDIGKQGIIMTQVPGELDSRVRQELELLGIDSPVIIPYDEEVYSYDLEKKSLMELPDSSPAVKAIAGLMDTILSQ